jgi:competence ComEA-like helix-hairpin-helix protein
MTPTLTSRLLDDSEVDALRSAAPPLTEGDDEEDLGFLEALRTPINLDAAMRFNGDDYAGDMGDVMLAPNRRPWAGSWWRQSEGALVFGWDAGDERTTLSTPLKAIIDPLAEESDGFSETLNNTEDRESEEYITARDAYREKQNEIVRTLVDYYNDLWQDLSGGTIQLEEDESEGWGLRHSEDDWFAPLDELSPMDKYALWRSEQPGVSGNPFFVSAWELLNHYSPAGGSWWGHCNGWAAASILTVEPREDIVADYRGHDLPFHPGDLKGLLSENYYSTYSNFYGERYYKEGDNENDLTAEAFWKLITIYMKDRGVPIVFDTSWGDQVWNYPTYSYVVHEVYQGPIDGETADTSGLVNINTADAATLATLPYIGSTKAARIIAFREDNGPYQSPDEIMSVRGIGRGTFARVQDLITVSSSTGGERWEFSIPFDYITDGVDETHLDDLDPNRANVFSQRYRFQLDLAADGTIVDSRWNESDLVEVHKPDFAWVPYGNATWRDGRSENPYLLAGDLEGLIGDTLARE